MRTILVSASLLLVLSDSASRADDNQLQPQSIEITAEDAGDGWQQWQVIDTKRAFGFRERISALHVDAGGDLWLGTSHGRLLRRSGEDWTREVAIPRLQITGMATGQYSSRPDPTENAVWLATNDGIRRLTPDADGWSLTEFRIYYQGHPGFVSGGYLPGEDAQRAWGYVDDIVIPRQLTAYSPFAVSTEHGLFSWGGYHGVWHHFLPHYWGANSPWLDTRELLPHRRPTCLGEDAEGNLWIGSDGDGLLRLNHSARRYYKRSPEENAQDGTEWTRFGSAEIGVNFDVVQSVKPGLDSGIWAALADRGKRRYLARLDGDAWQTLEMPRIERNSYRDGKVVRQQWWEGTPLCIAETAPGVLSVGVSGTRTRSGLYTVNWDEQEFRAIKEVPTAALQIEVTGEMVWVQTAWGVFSRPLAE